MGVSLNDLVNDKRTVPVEYLGRTIELTYRPNSLNRNFYEELRKRSAEKRAANEVLTDDQWAVLWFSKIVCGWDLTKGADEAPITEETLALLGTRFLLQAIETISQDLLPNPKRSASSQEPSPLTE